MELVLMKALGISRLALRLHHPWFNF